VETRRPRGPARWATQPPAEALARAVLDRALAVRRGESVVIEAWSHALPWARALVVEARRRGATPTLVLEDEEAFFGSLALAPRRRLPVAGRLPPATDAYVYLGGPEAFPRLLALPPAELESIVGRHGAAWWRAARASRLRAAGVALAAVTETAADRYGVDVDGWRREVLRASLIDPRRLARRARACVRGARPGSVVEIRHANGTALTLRLGREPPIVEDGTVDPGDRRTGRFWTGVPAGAIAWPLAAGVADGWWESNRPTFDRFAEPPVTVGARFLFRAGRLDEFAFDRGGEAFEAAYAHGGPGRDLATALTLGLNPAIAHAPELGELAAGTVGLVLGGRARGDGRPARFRYLSLLAGADVTVAGRPWIRAGAPAAHRAPRRGVRR